MKKSLLGFFMLAICIGIAPSTTFAQDAPGTYGDGGISADGGIAAPLTYSAPPSYIKGVKRNNGNGTTANGLAEVRLQTANSFAGDIILLDVRALNNPGVSLNAVGNGGYGSHEKGYLSYELTKNVIPAKKLIFYFQSSDGTLFCTAQ